MVKLCKSTECNGFTSQDKKNQIMSDKVPSMYEEYLKSSVFTPPSPPSRKAWKKIDILFTKVSDDTMVI